MFALLLAFAVSLCVTLAIVRLGGKLARFLHDHDISGPQKFHATPVPRIGGVGIVVGLMAAALGLWAAGAAAAETMGWVLICGIPAFGAGLVEDATKRVSPRNRLLATGVSAALGIWLLDAAIRHTGIPGLDWIVSFSAGAA
ncbi:MAG: glycosyl transferase, partial [Rubrivivax sp.]|nr:glycosyl transferase [Rubrivivax sp.]